MTEYLCKISVSYEVFCKLRESDIIQNLETNKVGLIVHISKENYDKLTDTEKKNLENCEVVNYPLSEQHKTDEPKIENLTEAAEKFEKKMSLSFLPEPKRIKQKYYIPKKMGKINTKKKGGR